MMAWFRRSEQRDTPFWEHVPFRGADVATLAQHGITCVSHGQFKAAISTGWAIWNAAGLDAEMAKILLDEGFHGWVDEGAPPFEQAEFLVACFHRLLVIHPEVPPDTDVWSLPRHVAEPPACYYGFRSWAASELCELAERADVLTPTLEAEMIRAFQQTPSMFMAARCDQHLRELLARRGLNR